MTARRGERYPFGAGHGAERAFSSSASPWGGFPKVGGQPPPSLTRLLYPPVVLVYFGHNFEHLHQQTVAADHVPAGEVMQLVEGGVGVADGAGQVACCGPGPVVASEKLCKADTVGIVLVISAVALVVQVERGDGLRDRGRVAKACRPCRLLWSCSRARVLCLPCFRYQVR